MAKFTLSLNGPLLNPTDDIINASFDYSGRYRLIAEIIRRYFDGQKSKPKNVLDVGGLGSFLDSLAGVPVTIYDSEAEDTGNQQKGDGANMQSIADGAFDVVATSDTLEHIPPGDRQNFVKELARASNDLVILCAPFADHGAADEEAELQKTYKRFAGQEHRWLAEHKQFGLPREKDILGYFKACGLSTVVLNHSSLPLWRTLMGINLLSNDVPDDQLHTEAETLNRYYNEQLLFRDFTPDSYRTFFVASKTRQLAFTPPKDSMTAGQAAEVIRLVNNFYSRLMKVAELIPAQRARLEAADRQKHDLELQLMDLTNRHNNIINSKTWRYTRPARTLYGVRRPKNKPAAGDK